MKKLPLLVRWLLILLVAALHSTPILADWYTSLLLGIGSGIAAGWIVAGLSYEVFFGKKAVDALPDHLRNNSAAQPGGSSPRSRAIGFLIWTAFMIACAVAIPIAKVVLE
jgi:hypothetical protein